jgi:hypothetical protein
VPKETYTIFGIVYDFPCTDHMRKTAKVTVSSRFWVKSVAHDIRATTFFTCLHPKKESVSCARFGGVTTSNCHDLVFEKEGQILDLVHN